MKRVFLVCLIFLWFTALPCYAETYSDSFTDAIEPEQPLLSDSSDPNNPESLMQDLKPRRIFSYLWTQIKVSFRDAASTLSRGVALVLLSVLLDRLTDSVSRGKNHAVFNLVMALSVFLICSESLSTSLSSLQKAIDDMGVFTAACIPSFSVVMIAAGEGIGAGIFSATMILVGEIGTLVSKNLLLPLTQVYLSLGICSIVGGEYDFSSLSRNIRKFVVWCVGILVFLFRTVLKLQFTTAAAGDRMAQKYLQMAVGTLIPMVGSSLSQGVDGLFSVASGVKTSFAVAGVLIVLSVMIPVLIRVGIYGAIWSLCRWFSSYINEKSVGTIAGVLENGFYMMLALGGCMALMGLFSFFGIMSQIK